MLDNKLKMIITEKYVGELLEAAIIRITYPNGEIKEIVVADKDTFHLINSCLRKATIIEKNLKHRCIVNFGNCYFPLSEIPLTNKNIYLHFNQFLEAHPYILNLYDEFWEKYPEKEGDYDALGRMRRKRRLIPQLICVTPQSEEELREMEDKHCRPD